ncbi:transcriptional regulator [Brevundimonas sp.]|uniref:transcriptional regulator n=1 Tax=Brevundimonas sp. TaxID=1871086 RepID=UPI003917F2C0
MTVRPSPDITRGLLSEAIQIFGSQSKLAAATGRSQNAVWHALKNGRVSAEFAMAIDAATDGQVSRSALRPDVYRPVARKAGAA